MNTCRKTHRYRWGDTIITSSFHSSFLLYSDYWRMYCKSVQTHKWMVLFTCWNQCKWRERFEQELILIYLRKIWSPFTQCLSSAVVRGSYLSVYLSVYLSHDFSVYHIIFSIHLTVCLSVLLYLFLSVYLSICLPICLSIYTLISIYLCLSVYPCQASPSEPCRVVSRAQKWMLVK